MTAPVQRRLPLQAGQDGNAGLLVEAETSDPRSSKAAMDPGRSRRAAAGNCDGGDRRLAAADDEPGPAWAWRSTHRARYAISLRPSSGALEHEVFAVLLLDTRHRLIEYVELFRGTIDGASVHPREVVKLALARNAAAIILAHPHPSGIAEPSAADELITQRLKEALGLVDIRVLDHLIIAGGEAVSLCERGLL